MPRSSHCPSLCLSLSLPPIRIQSSFGDHLDTHGHPCSWTTHLFLHGSCSLACTSWCLCSRPCRSLPPQQKEESLSVRDLPASYTFGYLTHTVFLGTQRSLSIWNTQVPPTDGVGRSPGKAHPAPQLASKPLVVSSGQISCSLSFKQRNVHHPKVGYQSGLSSEKSNDE